MKNIINKLENEIEKLKNEKKEILKEKQEFEIKYNEIIQTDFASITPKNVLNKLDQNQYNENEVTNEKQQEMQIGIMREEMEHMNLEKSKLKATLNEAINKCAAYVMKEKEWKQQLQEKQKTIDNLLTSKSKLKETLTDQIYTLR